MSVEVRILGPLEVWRDGRRLALGAAKQRALLALLLARRGEAARDVLVDALWEEAPPKGARNTLQVYVSSLRRVLGREAIETTASGYRLRLPADAVDADRFEQLFREGRERLTGGDAAGALELLVDALALWRGAAFSDFRYDAFAQPAAGRLDELRLACMEERVEAELQLGRHVELIAELEALILEHPLRERLRGQLILALYRSGRQSEALAQYQATRRMLADELGLEPSEELRDLQRMILGHDPKLATPDAKPRSNLPAQPTPFIGRERELAELVELIRSGRRRLITLTGAGGTGKTRVAIEAAAQLMPEFEHGVWWVPLQSLADPHLVLQTIANTIGTKSGPDRFIRDKRMLLMLDNFEHLLDSASSVGGLLSACPNLVVLATSREPLHVAAERKVVVPPMTEADAIALFAERAEQNGPPELVAAICRRVDCLPLAVELAAARTTVFSPTELLERLSSALPILTGGPRDVPSHQQTLRATLEWSHRLLEPTERRLFGRLSVFAGGCTSEAAEGICNATAEELEALTEKNLLVRAQGRYLMLETIREFAQDRFEASIEADATRESHAEWYLQLGRRARADIPYVQVAKVELAQQWASILEVELDNLRAAFRWFVGHERQEQALCLPDYLTILWGQGRLDPEGERWFREALAIRGRAGERTKGRALLGHANMLLFMGRATEAEPNLEEVLRISRLIDDDWLTIGALRSLGIAAHLAGDLEQARQRFEDALAVLSTEASWIGSLRQLLGQVELDAGNLDEARARFEDALCATSGSVVGIASLYSLAEVDRLDGLLDQAEERYSKALKLAASTSWNRTTWMCLGGLAAVNVARKDFGRAGRLWGATLRSLDEQDAKLFGTARHRYEPILNGRTEPEYLRALDGGRSLALDEAVAYALGEA